MADPGLQHGSHPGVDGETQHRAAPVGKEALTVLSALERANMVWSAVRDRLPGPLNGDTPPRIDEDPLLVQMDLVIWKVVVWSHQMNSANSAHSANAHSCHDICCVINLCSQMARLTFLITARLKTMSPSAANIDQRYVVCFAYQNCFLQKHRFMYA